MRGLLAVMMSLFLLSSCANFVSEESRRNTTVTFTNNREITAELLGVFGDSIYLWDVGKAGYFSESDNLHSSNSGGMQAMISVHHYSEIVRMRFTNTASPLLAGPLGFTVGALAGGLFGTLITHPFAEQPLPSELPPSQLPSSQPPFSQSPLSQPVNAHGGLPFPGTAIAFGSIGGVAGLVLGLLSIQDKTVYIYAPEDLPDVARFARFKRRRDFDAYLGY